MSEVKTEQSAASSLNTTTLKVVLFGMPDAGKTSLLGALAQSAGTQDKVLGGTLAEANGGLAELRRQVYDARPTRTVEQLVAYPFTIQPEAALLPAATNGGPLNVVVFDCDGRAANEFLSRRASPLSPAESDLARALLSADTLLLVVDASARTEVLKRDFGQFISFLELFQQSRSHQSDVSGLPVYLVLTKCDLIADEGDTPSVWMDKIEDRKRKVDQFFRAQLEKEAEEHHQPFGRIDLNVWATAVRRPALANVAAKTQEPYQVAELFRQVLRSAAGFHRHRRQAQRKLHLTFGAVLGVAALLGLLALAFFVFREPPAAAILENKIQNFLNSYPKNSTDRLLRAEEFMPRLKGLQDDIGFPLIAADRRKWVNEELAELQAYHTYAEKIAKDSVDPASIPSAVQLSQQKATLEALAPPKDRSGWADTPAVKQQKERLEDVLAIDSTYAQLKPKLEKLVLDAMQVKILFDKFKSLSNADKVKALNRRDEVKQLAKELPERKTYDKILIPGSQHVPWATILNFPDIQKLYGEWESFEPKLTMDPS